MLPKLAALHMSPCGPGCVKSRIGRKSVESFSLLSSATAVACTVRFQIRRNRDGSSKSKLNFRLFTQPGKAAPAGGPPAIQMETTMRKFLIIALGFVGLGLVTEPAAAKSVTVSKGSYSSGE